MIHRQLSRGFLIPRKCLAQILNQNGGHAELIALPSF